MKTITTKSAAVIFAGILFCGHSESALANGWWTRMAQGALGIGRAVGRPIAAVGRGAIRLPMYCAALDGATGAAGESVRTSCVQSAMNVLKNGVDFVTRPEVQNAARQGLQALCQNWSSVQEDRVRCETTRDRYRDHTVPPNQEGAQTLQQVRAFNENLRRILEERTQDIRNRTDNRGTAEAAGCREEVTKVRTCLDEMQEILARLNGGSPRQPSGQQQQ